MNPVIQSVVGHADPYNDLPEGIRMLYTREQYLWLSDDEKARLIQTETECEFDHGN